MYSKNDPWGGTVHLLSTFSGPDPLLGRPDESRPTRLCPNRQKTPSPHDARRMLETIARGEMTPVVRVLERPTSTTAFVYWSHPSHGHYGYQPWRAVVAPNDGYCALSGQRVRRGDSVFRPSKVRLSPEEAPANASVMILSSAMPTGEALNHDH